MKIITIFTHFIISAPDEGDFLGLFRRTISRSGIKFWEKLTPHDMWEKVEGNQERFLEDGFQETLHEDDSSIPTAWL